MKLGDGKGKTQQSVGVRDLLTGDELNDDETGAGWGDDDDLEDWGSLEDGKNAFQSSNKFRKLPKRYKPLPASLISYIF